MGNRLLLLIMAIFLLSFLACKTKKEIIPDKKVKNDNIMASKYLTKLWVTDKIFSECQSLFYDENSHIIYVANINGIPTEKDGNGFISQLSLSGKIINLNWVNGLNAPKGMGIYNDKLYVADIDTIVEIDIATATIENSYLMERAKFLSDIAISDDGTVYVSDMLDSTIYKLQNGRFSFWIKSYLLESPNGLFCIDNGLLVGVETKILKININDKQISAYISDTGSADGLSYYEKSNYIISDWLGKLSLVSTKNLPFPILEFTDLEISTGNIEVVPEEKILLVPTIFDNRVIAYRINF